MSNNEKPSEYTNKLKKYIDLLAQNPAVSKEGKVQCIIQATALTCGIVAAQPIPFADFFILTPIQLVMVTALNKVLDSPFEESSLKEILTSLVGVIGWGTLAQHTILGLYKTVIPFMGAITTIPLVYAATVALGVGAKTLIEAKRNDQVTSDEELKKVINDAKKAAAKDSKKLTVSEAMKQISSLFASVEEYENYKNELLNLQEKIYSAYESEIVADLDISRMISMRREIIQERLLEYKNIELTDYVVSMFSVMNSKDFIQVAEVILSDINYDFEHLNFLDYKQNENESFYEIQTQIGVFLVFKNEKIKIINLELNDDYKNNSIFEYMSIPSEEKILKDIEIKNEFHNIIKKAKKYIYIISPRVSEWVYKEVCPLLKKQIEMYPDLEIRVLYGLCDYSNNSKKYKDNIEDKEKSRNCIKKYKEVLGNNFLFKESNTHVKLLICDDEEYLLGSMNLLSFAGNYKADNNGKLHHEISIVSNDKIMLNRLKQTYFMW